MSPRPGSIEEDVMAMEIYWGSGSPFAWRALLALEVKRVPYESHLIQFSKGEQRTPEYLAMNPRGKVPTLRDGDYVVYESVAVLGYLDAKVPEPPLFGTTPEQRGTILRHVAETDAYLQPALVTTAQAIFSGQLKEKEAAVREAVATIHQELAAVEKDLAKSPWVAASSLSAADIVLFPFVQIIQRAAGKPEASALDLGLLPLRERYPSIAAWIGRIEALPGYERTYPPHWRES
jgi:glutathione S-transferase